MSYTKCKGCKDRVPGCHSTCKYYLEFRKKRDEELKKMHEQKEIDNWSYAKLNGIERWRKRHK